MNLPLRNPLIALTATPPNNLPHLFVLVILIFLFLVLLVPLCGSSGTDRRRRREEEERRYRERQRRRRYEDYARGGGGGEYDVDLYADDRPGGGGGGRRHKDGRRDRRGGRGGGGERTDASTTTNDLRVTSEKSIGSSYYAQLAKRNKVRSVSQYLGPGNKGWRWGAAVLLNENGGGGCNVRILFTSIVIL